ncbi:MAG: ribonuclease H [Gudongella sp.]|nr:ribonuclease H [Gudongella sp.]
MNMLIYEMEITEKHLDFYTIIISNNIAVVNIKYNPLTKDLIYPEDMNPLNELKENEAQLKAILKNKSIDTFYPGFKLRFALRDKKDVIAYNDISKIVVLDKRENSHKIYTTDKSLDNIHQIYTDGCYLEKLGRGGYSLIIKSPEGEYSTQSIQTDKKNSSLIELIAAIKAVELLKDIERLRIITDSQYVRKGLTEWIINWKLNDWNTINGTKAKNIEYWKKFDKLTDGKYIEFQWVKAHSGHFENTLCDLMAKEAAKDVTI